MKDRIEEIRAEGIESSYSDDESNACDWETPWKVVEQ